MGERERALTWLEKDGISKYFLRQWLLVALLKGLELWPSGDGAVWLL